MQKVLDHDRVVFGEALPPADQPRVLNKAASRDLAYALSRTPAGALAGRESAGKTGAWEYSGSTTNNADAWMVGYTPGIAMAVWIGDQKAQHPIQDATGATIWGSGLPATIYRDVMNAAHQSMPVPPPATFPAASDTGNVNPPGSVPR